MINGKTYLQTQTNLCQRGNELALILLKSKLQSEEKIRLTRTLKHVKNCGAVVEMLKRAMFDRLLTIGSFIFLDFNTYLKAFMFHSLSASE